MKCFQEAVTNRRTNYALGRNVTVLPSQITAAVEKMAHEVPSAFNMQSARVVLAFGEHHDKIWSITMDALRAVVPADKFAPTEAKIQGFAAAYGTVLFFEETSVVEKMQQQFAAYAENFPVWSEQASGIAQFAVWVALSEANIGASLQHYNPLPDAAAAAEWNVPASWKLRAMMPFGSNEGGFGEKTFMDDAERFRVFG